MPGDTYKRRCWHSPGPRVAGLPPDCVRRRLPPTAHGSVWKHLPALKTKSVLRTDGRAVPPHGRCLRLSFSWSSPHAPEPFMFAVTSGILLFKTLPNLLTVHLAETLLCPPPRLPCTQPLRHPPVRERPAGATPDAAHEGRSSTPLTGSE